MVSRSYAKLNLYLAVLNKRPDNYHNLFTLFERISLYDTISFTRRRDRQIRLRCASAGVPSDATNLCCRSAALLQRASGCDGGVDIVLKKRIPAGAGLGGGSSNAACTLEALNRLWGIHYSRPRLVSLARTIGADCPFFLYNSSFAVARERGDRVIPQLRFPGRRLWHVVIIPQTVVSTPLIYKKWDVSRSKHAHDQAAMKMLTKHRLNVKLITQYIKYLKTSEISRLGDLLFNDLEPITESLYPEVRRIKTELRAQGEAAVMMSGSGPAVFAILNSRSKAGLLAKTLKSKDASWNVFTASTV